MRVTRALDLSFPPFDRAHAVSPLPSDLAALAERLVAHGGAAHATAVAASTDEPQRGAFNGSMAAALTRWKDQ